MTSPPNAEEARAVLLGNISIFLSIVIWSSMLPVTEILLRRWDPISLSVVRLGLATLVLNAAYVVLEGPGVYLRAMPWRAIWRLGASGIGISTLFLVFGIRYSNAIVAGIIVTAGPVVGAVLARLMMGTAYRPGLWLGIALAVAGGLTTVLGKTAAEAGFGGGEVLILIGIVLWLSYSIGVQMHLKGISQLGITALTALTGVVALCALAALALGFGLVERRMSFDTESVSLLVYLACGPAALSILLWHYGVSRAGVTVAAMYSNLTPVIVMLIAMTYGSYPTWWHLAGGVLIVAGVLYVQLRPRLDRRRERKRTP